MRLTDADAGVVRVGEVDFTQARGAGLRVARKHIQMVFQDPFTSLNPRRRVGRIIADAADRPWRPGGTGICACRRTADAGWPRPGAAQRFPHEFSGGQRQRIGIARAGARPRRAGGRRTGVGARRLGQAQVLALLETLKTRLRLAMLFITHDLNVAAQVCDRIAVMRLGEIVEIRPTADLLSRPEHPYTQALLAAIPARQRKAPPMSSETLRDDVRY